MGGVLFSHVWNANRRIASAVVAGRRPYVIPPTGRQVRVAHMHMIRFEHGQNSELWHVMDTIAMLGQLGLLPAPEAGIGRG